MSRVRFYLDEHVSRAVIQGLRLRGVDLLTVAEAGRLAASDEAQLAYAKEERLVIFTQDADFLRLAAAGASHAGIVYAPQGAATGRIIRGLVLVFQIMEAEEMISQVEFI